MFSFSLFLIILAIIFVVKGVIIVQQAEVVIVERLGKFDRVLESGFNFIIPIIEAPRAIDWKTTQKGFDGMTYSIVQKRTKIDLREAVYDFPRQNVITKDNASISINALLYFQIVDPKSAVYEIKNLPEAIEKLTQTNLRNLVGQLDLDESLVSRDKINQELRAILDDATNKWGVKVNRVELQDIIPPADIQSAMEKQMKAERDRRAAILEAEGLKKSAVLKAEGEKEAIGRIITALADKGQPDKYLIAMKYLETMKTITSGQNNKVVYMPYEATGILSSVDGIKQMLDTNAKL